MDESMTTLTSLSDWIIYTHCSKVTGIAADLVLRGLKSEEMKSLS